MEAPAIGPLVCDRGEMEKRNEQRAQDISTCYPDTRTRQRERNEQNNKGKIVSMAIALRYSKRITLPVT